MRIASFVLNGKRALGLVSPDGKTVTPLALSADDARRGAQVAIDLLVAGKSLPGAAGQPVPIGDVLLEAPLPLPRRNLWCVGRNYHAHAKELSSSVFKDNDANPEAWPIVFTKVPECVVGPHDDVSIPVDVSDQNYEAELAVVIDDGGKNISNADAMQHVFGYTVVNDVTARDVQMRHQQWDMGKSLDRSPLCPFVHDASSNKVG